MPTVRNSAVASANSAAGGHLTQHIKGVNAPAGLSQAGKTMWTSEAEYKGAWGNYETSKTINGVVCAGLGTVRQVVTVQNVLKKPLVGAIKCTAGPNGGQCTASTRTQCSSIQFDFINVGGHWILQTSYPMNCKS